MARSLTCAKAACTGDTALLGTRVVSGAGAAPIGHGVCGHYIISDLRRLGVEHKTAFQALWTSLVLRPLLLPGLVITEGAPLKFSPGFLSSSVRRPSIVQTHFRSANGSHLNVEVYFALDHASVSGIFMLLHRNHYVVYKVFSLPLSSLYWSYWIQTLRSVVWLQSSSVEPLPAIAGC